MVIGDVDDVDGSGFVELGEAFADVALGEAGVGGDDAAGESGCADGQQGADHFGADAEAEQPAQSEGEVDRFVQARRLGLAGGPQRRSREAVRANAGSSAPSGGKRGE